MVLATGVGTMIMANQQQVEQGPRGGVTIQTENVLFGVPGFDVIQ